MKPVSEKPTVTLVEKNATTKVMAQLYGAVSPARLEAERASLKHRLNQLSPVPPKVQRVYEEDNYKDYVEWAARA